MATLIERTNAKGQKFFQIQFHYQATVYKRSLGKTTKHKAKTTKSRLENRLREVKAGFLTPPPSDADIAEYFIYGREVRSSPLSPTDSPAFTTFESAKKLYLDYEIVRLAETHYKTKLIHLKHFEKFLGKQSKGPITAVRLSDVQSYVVARRKKVKPVTVNKELKTVSHFFNSAVKHGYVDSNPVDGVDLLKEAGSLVRFRTLKEINQELERGGYNEKQIEEMKRARYLPEEEITELLGHCLNNDEWFHPILLTYAYTGIRRGEGGRLQWQHVEFDRRVIRVGSRKQSKSKEIAIRDIDMHDTLYETLQRLHQDRKGAYVFSDKKGSPVKVDFLSRRLKALVDKTSFSGIVLHALRHSFASNLAAKGVDQRIIDTFMGHQTEEMRKRYQHLFPERKTEAIHRLTY